MVRFLISALILAAICAGQQETPAPKPVPVPRDDPKPRAEPEQQPRRQPMYERPRIFRVEGKVLMNEGGAPPERVLVESICGGQTLEKVFSDTKGGFSVQIGAPSTGLRDASLGGAPGGPQILGSSAPHTDCLLQARLSGFRAEPVRLGVLSDSSVNYARIILRPIEGVSGYTFSATSLSAPPAARKAQEKAAIALRKNRIEEAEKELRRAVQLHPQFAVAWYELGRLLVSTSRAEDGRQALEKAVAADPKYLNPYPVLAQLAVAARQWDALARHTQAVISLNPFFSADIYLFSAQANLKLQRLEIAERHAREAVRMDEKRELPVARRLLARVLEERGNLKEAAAELREYLANAPAGADREQTQRDLAALEERASRS